jgi:hypothetical protein
MRGITKKINETSRKIRIVHWLRRRGWTLVPYKKTPSECKAKNAVKDIQKADFLRKGQRPTSEVTNKAWVHQTSRTNVLCRSQASPSQGAHIFIAITERSSTRPMQAPKSVG